MCTATPSISPNNTHHWQTTFDHTQETGAMRAKCMSCGVIMWRYNGIVTVSWNPEKYNLALRDAGEYIEASSLATESAKSLAERHIQ